MKNINKANKIKTNDLYDGIVWFVSKPLFTTVFFPERLVQINIER